MQINGLRQTETTLLWYHKGAISFPLFLKRLSLVLYLLLYIPVNLYGHVGTLLDFVGLLKIEDVIEDGMPSERCFHKQLSKQLWLGMDGLTNIKPLLLGRLLHFKWLLSNQFKWLLSNQVVSNQVVSYKI